MSGPASAALVYGVALEPNWAWWLNNRPLVLFGNARYSFYLLHSVFVRPFFHDLRTQEVRNNGFIGIAIWTVMMLIISSLVYRFVEETARRKLLPKRDNRRPSAKRSCGSAPMITTAGWRLLPRSAKFPGVGRKRSAQGRLLRPSLRRMQRRQQIGVYFNLRRHGAGALLPFRRFQVSRRGSPLPHPGLTAFPLPPRLLLHSRPSAGCPLPYAWARSCPFP
jgi:hypothetical protein